MKPLLFFMERLGINLNILFLKIFSKWVIFNPARAVTIKTSGDISFDEIVDNIKSPNGTTEAGINSLSENSFDKIIYTAI